MGEKGGGRGWKAKESEACFVTLFLGPRLGERGGVRSVRLSEGQRGAGDCSVVPFFRKVPRGSAKGLPKF